MIGTLMQLLDPTDDLIELGNAAVKQVFTADEQGNLQVIYIKMFPATMLHALRQL